MSIFFDKPAPRGLDMQGQVDWRENQVRIDAVVREARLRTLCVIRAEGDSIVGGPEVLCDAELPDSWRPRSDTVLT